MEEQTVVNDEDYIEKKRTELKLFFKDAKFAQEVTDKIIENELRPLQDNRPYISASCSGEIKSEYEVMSGQPFTKFKEQNKPFSDKEIRDILKDSPIIAEKARQIQIVINNEGRKELAVPLDKINIVGYNEMRKELDSARNGDEINKINYNNMTALMNSVNDYQAQCFKENHNSTLKKPENEGYDSDDKEFEAIENVVSQYTDKSYETRFQETKDMLLKLAEHYDEPEYSNKKDSENAIQIKGDPILKASSSQLIKGQQRRTAFEEIKEHYSINQALNIALKDNPVKLNLSGQIKHESKIEKNESEEEINDVEKVFPKTFEAKLKDTEKTLREINSVLNNTPISNYSNNVSLNQEYNIKNITTHDSEVIHQRHEIVQKFDENMEQTLQNALEDIFDVSNTENKQNREMEFKEMKNLARNIVEGAENLSTLIREDITNKLNSMNELLNDVNEALENSRKSNIAYEKVKNESDTLKLGVVIEGKDDAIISDDSNVIQESNEKDIVNDFQIDDIHSAIGKLNAELKCHEDRINESKVRYEKRNEECKAFIKEVDEVMEKSRQILHPAKDNKSSILENANQSVGSDPYERKTEQDKKVRKELWDIDLPDKYNTDKKLKAFKEQELERGQRIDNLLYDIKDKMKENKEVLRVANSLLRREESRKKNQNSSKIRELPIAEIDNKAQGDHEGLNEPKDKELNPSSGIPSIGKVLSIVIL